MSSFAVVFLLAAWQIAPADALTGIRAQVEAGNLSDAEARARRYTAAHPESADGHFLLGYVLFRETKARESLAEYTEGAKYKAPSATDLRVVGADYVLLGAYGDADKWFTKATEFEPQNALGWYYLGRTKYNENRFEEAIAAFNECLKLSPKHIRAEDNLGLSLQGLGRMDEARRAFLTAIDWARESGSRDPWPFIDYGAFLLENNQAADAVTPLQQAIQFAPTIARAHQFLGKAYLAMHELPQAQAELEQAVRLEPKSARAHYVLGQLYQKQGQNEKAKQEFARYSHLNESQSDDERHEYRPPDRNQ